MQRIYRNSVIAASLSLALLLGCSSQSTVDSDNSVAQSDAGAQVFEVKGRLKSITADFKTAIIEHETIPNYMPAMTMPFTVKNAAEVKSLKPGDAIAFRFTARWH